MKALKIKDDLKNQIIDLSEYNLISALQKAIKYSTLNFLEYDNRVIHLELRDEETRKIIAPLKLKNTILSVKQRELRKVSGIK